MLMKSPIKKYFGIGAILFLVIPCSFAASTPPYTIKFIKTTTNSSPQVVSVLVNGAAEIAYLVTDNKKNPGVKHTLTFQTSIPGLTQDTGGTNACQNPIVLHGKESCVLSLMFKAGVSPGTYEGFSLIDSTGVSTRPSLADTLKITVSNYTDFYISYISTTSATAIINYIKGLTPTGLGGVIFWELRGDSPYLATPSTSLLRAIGTAFSGYLPANHPPYVMAYWSDWNVYSSQPNRAIPEPTYGVPGGNSIDTGMPTVNTDFTDKLEGINTITYGFLEAQALTFTYYDQTTGQNVTVPNATSNKIGTLYFNDPWSDLAKAGIDTYQDALCENPVTNPICEYALQNRTKAIEFNNGASLSNFNAFARLAHSNPSNSLGPLKKIFSVGGYGHNNTFEDMFNNCPGDSNGAACMALFVKSASSIVSHYNMDGIDLDYENPDMTHADSTKYAALIKLIKADTVLGSTGKIISVTVLADPAYLAGTRTCTTGVNTCGFGSGVLSTINTSATNINLETYDFYGAFSYPGPTAFLTNLYKTTDTLFSIVTSVNAALTAGITASHLSVGIPAYGRALTGISSANGGLYQTIPASPTGLPRGDLDTSTCNTSVPFTDPSNACTGSFQYSYILTQMLPNGLTATENTEAVGTTAYGASWSPAVNPTLTIINTGRTLNHSYDFSIAIGTITSTGAFSPLFAPSGTFNIDGTYNKETYTPGASIAGLQGLTVQWTLSWGKSGTCPLLFDFTGNSTISMNVSGASTVDAVCQYT